MIRMEGIHRGVHIVNPARGKFNKYQVFYFYYIKEILADSDSNKSKLVEELAARFKTSINYCSFCIQDGAVKRTTCLRSFEMLPCP